MKHATSLLEDLYEGPAPLLLCPLNSMQRKAQCHRVAAEVEVALAWVTPWRKKRHLREARKHELRANELEGSN